MFVFVLQKFPNCCTTNLLFTELDYQGRMMSSHQLGEEGEVEGEVGGVEVEGGGGGGIREEEL